MVLLLAFGLVCLSRFPFRLFPLHQRSGRCVLLLTQGQSSLEERRPAIPFSPIWAHSRPSTPYVPHVGPARPSMRYSSQWKLSHAPPFSRAIPCVALLLPLALCRFGGLASRWLALKIFCLVGGTQRPSLSDHIDGTAVQKQCDVDEKMKHDELDVEEFC